MADSIKVNSAAWKALPADQRDAVTDIVTQAFGQVKIVADAKAPAPKSAKFALPGGFFCKLLCQLAGAAGHIACKKLPPATQPICNSSVDAVQAICESKCK